MLPKNKATARRRFTEFEKKYERGDYDPWSSEPVEMRLSLSEAVDRFLDSRSHLRPKTIKAYTSAMRTLKGAFPPAIGLRDLDEATLRRVIHDDSVKAATRHYRYRHINAFLNWAVKGGFLESNPLDQIETPKNGKRVPEDLTRRQVEKLLTAIDWDYDQKRALKQVEEGDILWLKDVILIAVNTGMRIGEIVNLRWNDIDFDTRFITVRNREDGFQTKSGHERSIPLAGEAREVLQRLSAARTDELDGPVLTGKRGRRLNPEYVSRRFKYYVRLAKLPENIRFHSLRHTCASWMVQKGVSLPIVQAVLGHSSVQVTQKYAHLAPDVMMSAMQDVFGK